MVKLSLTIPYYKTYELTCKLMDVLIPQLTDEVEVFLVDDGCNETRLNDYIYDERFKEKWNYIHVYHLLENGGMSVALNNGIKSSNGKYIGFIDSDDLVTENYIEELLKAIDDCDDDLIYLDWQDMNNGEIVHRPQNYAQWRSIYKKEIVPLFDENIRHSADVPFQNEIESKPRTRYYIDKVLYIYNSDRVGSLTWEKANGDMS